MTHGSTISLVCNIAFSVFALFFIANARTRKTCAHSPDAQIVISAQRVCPYATVRGTLSFSERFCQATCRSDLLRWGRRTNRRLWLLWLLTGIFILDGSSPILYDNHASNIDKIIRSQVHSHFIHKSSLNILHFPLTRYRHSTHSLAKMKSTVVWVVLATMLMAGGDPVSAWGGVFNRFTPELLGNLGYGGGGNSANALFYEVCLCVCVCSRHAQY